jgi:hypothetical protein
MAFVRYGIPLALAVTGIVLLFAADESVKAEAWAGFTGAAIAVLLLNLLFRIGVQGEEERDREVEARAYFDRHGRWPDDAAPERRPEPPPHRVGPQGRLPAARPPRRR